MSQTRGSLTSEDEIERLVRRFYQRIRADETLGPIFARAIGDDWEPHLQKMFAFWSSVMLMTGRYKGQPMATHMQIKSIVPAHFDRWLALFRQTAQELCDAETAAAFIQRAERIANSLKLGMFFNPATADIRNNL
jgi:hemoglobin